MKILMVNKFLYPGGGSETYIFKLGEYLQSVGHEVQYFGMEHEGRCVGNRAEQYTSDMDFHTNNPFQKLSYPLKTIYSAEAKRKMRTVLDDFQPDVIHINNFNYQLTPSILYAAKKYKEGAGKKVRIVFTAHDYQLLCPNHMFLDGNGNICEDCRNGHFVSCTKKNCIHHSKAKSLIGTAEATLYKHLGTYRCFDTIICCSEFLKKKMDTNPVFADKTVAMHNFIDVPAASDDTQKEDYVLYFGRYAKEKGIETILAAKNIPFVFAGTGEWEEEINRRENIRNLGFQTGDALTELIRKARCSVYPSIWYENCPFSVMESIALGTPVIGADIGGIPELIEDGKTGLLFESGNTAAFEKAVATLLQDDALAEEMHQNCLKQHFDTAREYGEKLLKLYTE